MDDPLDPLLYIKQLYARMQRGWQHMTRTRFARLSIYLVVIIELNVAMILLLHTCYRIGITAILHGYEQAIGVEVPTSYAELFANRLINEVFWTLLVMVYIVVVTFRFMRLGLHTTKDDSESDRNVQHELIQAFRIPLPVSPKGRLLRKLHGWAYAV